MNKKLFKIVGGTALAALIIGLLAGRLLFAPGDAHQHEETGSSSETADTTEPEQWTCSMHPQIIQPDAGDCPICGMDLIPLESDDGADTGPRTMSMSESSRALAEIRTTVVKREFPE